MKPDRANYEIWLIDYLDGGLDNEQVLQLLSFLDANPDIREEFEELSQYSVKSDFCSFPLKNSIKKSVLQLPDDQFELLCIAASENDLSSDQRAELESIITKNENKRKVFQLIKSLRLAPPAIKYNKKHSLRKRTIAQKVIRLSVIGISAAAGIAVLISLFTLTSEGGDKLPAISALKKAADSSQIIKTTESTAPGNQKPQKEEVNNPLSVNLLATLQKTISDEMKSFPEMSEGGDTTAVNTDIQRINVSMIDFVKEVKIGERELTTTLVAINTEVISPESPSEKSGFSKFIAKTFRERIFKSPTPETGSLRAYEVADAGISGLNKLFGWEMSLQKNRDEKGELKSLRFNSKLLKFNTPVKRAQLEP